MPKPQHDQPAWNPHASRAWRVAWHQAGYRRIVRYRDEYHDYMFDRASECLALSDDELRRRLWP